MPGFLRENSWPVVASVVLHGLLAAGLLLTAFISSNQHLPTLQPLPIDAVVVDSKVLRAAQRAQAERAEQEVARARAAAEAKAAANVEELAAEDAKVAAAQQSEAQARAEAQAQAEAQANAARQAKAANQVKTAETAKAIEDARRAAEARKILEAKQVIAEAKQAAEARQAAEAKQAADAKQAAEAKQAADAKRAADERAKQEREAELRRQLADEEHVSAVESGPLRDRYITLLRNRIQNAWIKPPSATAGIDCMVQVTQIPGGEVTGARVTQCNGDAAVRQSIENAVYRASPLPDPPDPALFERNLVLRFRPNE
jgi:colicin import membrane protein